MPDATPAAGIKAGYPRLPISTKARAYAQLCRPFTLQAPMVGALCAVGMVIQYGHATLDGVLDSWRRVVYAMATLLMVQVGSNFVNQATDVVEDRVNRSYRPIPRGVVSVDEALTIGHVLWFLAAARAVTLGAPFTIIVLAIVLLSYLYSTPPLRLKARLHIGYVAVAAARGLLGLVGVWSLFGPLDAPQPWVAGGILFAFLLGGVASKDFLDVAGDALANVQTWVVRYGSNGARLLMLPFILSPILTLPLSEQFGLLDLQPAAYAASVGTILTLAHRLLFAHDRPNRYLEGTPVWTFMYLSLMAMMLAFGLGGYL